MDETHMHQPIPDLDDALLSDLFGTKNKNLFSIVSELENEADKQFKIEELPSLKRAKKNLAELQALDTKLQGLKIDLNSVPLNGNLAAPVAVN